MRRSSLVTVLLLTFTLFTFLGFRTAAYTGTLSGRTQNASGEIQNRRIILIQVDDLKAAKPALKSVWVGVFFQSKNQAVISFIPIYPAPAGQPSTEALARSFAMNRSGKPVNAFWRRIESHEIERDGYIVVDDHALHELAGWMSKQGNFYFGSASQVPTAVPGEWFLELGCGSIQNSGDQIAQFTLPTLEDHLLSDIPMDKISADWQNLTAADQPFKCELVQE